LLSLHTTHTPETFAPFGSRTEERHHHDAHVVIDGTFHGWTLNVSRGGVRVIVPAESADEIDTVLYADRVAVSFDGQDRVGQVVWHAVRPGGFVLGIQLDG
jgi:hypothetical protein